MAFRKFVDRDGLEWEVRPRTKSDWDFEPTGNNPGRARTAPSPGYEKDPFELSREELQKLLDSAPPPRVRPTKSPFGD
ncbi:MAG: hypothetical protein ACKVZ0_18985 [Gemmatimonadales bacterium]